MRKRFFRIAEKAAQHGQGTFKVGAVVVNGNRILSVGYNNMKKSHPIMCKNSTSAKQREYIKLHAEVAALITANYDSIDSRTSIYVFRKRRDGYQGLAKPCDVCTNFIQSLGIKKVYFSLNYSGYGDMTLLPEGKI